MQAQTDKSETTRKAIIADTITGVLLILAMIPPAFFYYEFQDILVFASPVVVAWIFNTVGYLGIKNKSALLVKIWLGYNIIFMYYTMIVGLTVPLLMLVGRGDYCEKHHDPSCSSKLRLFFPLLALLYFFITYIFRVVLLFIGCQLQLPIAESAFAEASADYPSLIDLFRMPKLFLRYFKLPWATQFAVLITLHLILLSIWTLGSLIVAFALEIVDHSALSIFYLILAVIILLVPPVLALVGATNRQPVALIVYVVCCLTPMPFLFVIMSAVGMDWFLLAAATAFIPMTCITLYKALRLYYLLQVKSIPDDEFYALI